MVAPGRVGAGGRARRRHLRDRLAGAAAGCIQFSEETDPDYFSAAVDIFVGTAAQGRGVGPDAMRTLIRWLMDVRGHHRVTVDPAAENARAIHVYEKLGFGRVGVMRSTSASRTASGATRSSWSSSRTSSGADGAEAAPPARRPAASRAGSRRHCAGT